MSSHPNAEGWTHGQRVAWIGGTRTLCASPGGDTLGCAPNEIAGPLRTSSARIPPG